MRSTVAEEAPMTVKEDIQVAGSQVVDIVKRLVKEGSVRRITVKNRKGRVIFDLPLAAGFASVALLPGLVLLGSAAAFLTECTLSIERDSDEPE